MATKLSNLRNKFRLLAKDQWVTNNEIDFWINQIYLSIHWKLRTTNIMQDYATISDQSVKNDKTLPYITTPATGLVGWDLEDNQTIKAVKNWTDYEIYLEKAKATQKIYAYYEPTELTNPDDITIFTNKSIDNILLMYAVAEYFDSIYIPQQAQILRNKATQLIEEVWEKNDEQEFIINTNNNEY